MNSLVGPGDVEQTCRPFGDTGQTYKVSPLAALAACTRTIAARILARKASTLSSSSACFACCAGDKLPCNIVDTREGEDDCVGEPQPAV